GFMKDGKLPRANRILFSDAIGTVVGAMLGTSTVTSYIESAAGVSSGGKTGFASVITSICFLLALFFYPFVRMIGTGIPGEKGITLYPVTAPALIIIGSLIMGTVKRIKWEDHTESIPAFLALLGIPLTYNIGDGMAMGFISYVFLKLCSGRYKELNWVLIIISVLFIIRYAFILK
ncbi:MAG: NCS2 family permease, partial [Candidatus Omnitrophica bacterium]|nr:NCS2 family permease [Candidatus Omnitrophota bacterium]